MLTVKCQLINVERMVESDNSTCNHRSKNLGKIKLSMGDEIFGESGMRNKILCASKYFLIKYLLFTKEKHVTLQ